MGKRQIREQKAFRVVNSYTQSFADGWDLGDTLECMRLRGNLFGGGGNFNLAEQEYRKFMAAMVVKYAALYGEGRCGKN